MNLATLNTITVSTPDATAFDLIGYEAQIGGLDAVATILAELAAKLDADKLAALASRVPMPWAQRLGYLLERIGEAPQAKLLKDYVRKHAHEAAALVPSEPVAGHLRDELSDVSLQVLKALRTKERLTIAQLASITKANRNMLKVKLRELVSAGRVRQHGKARATWYSL